MDIGIGDSAVYVDRQGRARAALVTLVYEGDGAGGPSVNLVLVHADARHGDPYGRQIEREVGVPHRSRQPAPVNYWLCPGEPDQRPRPFAAKQ